MARKTTCTCGRILGRNNTHGVCATCWNRVRCPCCLRTLRVEGSPYCAACTEGISKFYSVMDGNMGSSQAEGQGDWVDEREQRIRNLEDRVARGLPVFEEERPDDDER